MIINYDFCNHKINFFDQSISISGSIVLLSYCQNQATSIKYHINKLLLSLSTKDIRLILISIYCMSFCIIYILFKLI